MNIEYLYNSGKLPLKYYNQLNGKTAQENYNLIKNNVYQKNEYTEIKNHLSAVIETALNEILSNFDI